MVDVTAATRIQEVLAALDRALARSDLDDTLDLFADECYWRDLLSFTWNIRTFEGKADIREMLKNRLADVRPSGWAVDEQQLARDADDITEGFISFSTATAYGYGYVRLKDGLIWTLLTTMQGLKGHQEAVGFERPWGGKHGNHQHEPTWSEERNAELSELGVTTEPYVLIVGGGHSGIILGARLRQLNVPAIIVDKNPRPGDNWRNRYKTLQLHNPNWENPFPYLDFPDNWPVFMDKDKYAEWLETYTRIMELDYWGSTEAKAASYDDDRQVWTVTLDRDGDAVTLHPRQLVLATGASGCKPKVPSIPGQDVFAGIQQHSADHPGPDGMEGQRVVVIGSSTSAHDICAALFASGADVTMVQRSSTHVVRMDPFLKYQLGPLYSPEAAAKGITAEKADVLAASVPYDLFFDFQKSGLDKVREVDADFYKELEAAGFKLDFGPGDSGLFGKATTRLFNYYIEIGTSQLIIDGKIKLASGSGVKGLTRHSVILDDGRELPADIVIYATGFTSMEQTVRDLMSQEVADKVGQITGIGSGVSTDPGPWEGEVRNMYKPTRQEGLWFHGGLIAHARFYSHFLALQLKARMETIPTPVYDFDNRVTADD